MPITNAKHFALLCTIPLFGMAALSTILGSDSTNGGTSTATPCPSSMTFVVGGTGDPNGVNAPGVPAGPRTNVWYPATVDDNAQRVGRDNLTGAVNNFRSRCPASHVTLYGYSGGAQVAGDVRDRMNGTPNMNAVLVADPRAPGGLAAILPSIPGWWTNQGPRPASSIPTSNICRDNDPVCNLGNPLQDPIHAINAGIGWLQGAHNYTPREVNPAPGNHPIPAPQIIPEIVKVPIRIPTPRQLSPVEPFISGQVQKQWTPPAVKRGTPARNVGEIVPPALAGFVPPELARIALPH